METTKIVGNRRLGLLMLMGGLVLGAYLIGQSAEIPDETSDALTAATHQTPPVDPPESASEEFVSASADPEVTRPSTPAQQSRRIERTEWERLVLGLTAARHAREELEGGQGQDSRPAGHLQREYIQDAIQELHPLIVECYELARVDSPELEGRLVVSFTVGGEPDVGGVVEEARIGEDSEIASPLLEECVSETIYTLELPAPDDGGQVVVTFPFIFRPDDDPEPADDPPPSEE